MPLNESAPPYLPAIDQVAPVIVPVLLLPDKSATVVPLPASKLYAATRPAGPVFETVTVTGAEGVVLFDVSRATAVSVCVPFATEFVVHETVYGELVISPSMLLPSTLNWTPATATLSDADAVTVIVLETVVPPVGDVNDTVGGIVSAVTVAVAWFGLGLMLPAASSACTR